MVSSALIGIISCARLTGAANQDDSSRAPVSWESKARLQRSPVPFAGSVVPGTKAVPGTLRIDTGGIGFQSEKLSYKWPFLDIHTFDLSGQDLTLTIYQNRHWHEPGEKRFHFKLQQPVPAAIATAVTERIERPVRNGDPDMNTPAIAEIPARHTTRFGGSNGTLRLLESGIDYVSKDPRDSHSWRWSDIQTIANPDPWALRVTAYREIAEFELKRPLSRALFDYLWQKVYAQDLNLSAGKEGVRQ
jgi:hypothetical protein